MKKISKWFQEECPFCGADLTGAEVSNPKPGGPTHHTKAYSVKTMSAEHRMQCPECMCQGHADTKMWEVTPAPEEVIKKCAERALYESVDNAFGKILAFEDVFFNDVRTHASLQKRYEALDLMEEELRLIRQLLDTLV